MVRIPKTCINFQNVDPEKEDDPEHPNAFTLENYYHLAGVSIFGESMGNMRATTTFARTGAVTFRNTGFARLNAGDSVFFLWPLDDDSLELRADSKLIDEKLRVAITVGVSDFRKILEKKLLSILPAFRSHFAASYKANHYVGQCLLSAEQGQEGYILLGM